VLRVPNVFACTGHQVVRFKIHLHGDDRGTLQPSPVEAAAAVVGASAAYGRKHSIELTFITVKSVSTGAE